MNETLQEHLLKYECVLLMQQTSEQELIDLDPELPSDVHLVTVEKNFTLEVDAVRAYKMSDIFDAYFDLGYSVLSIKSGFGRIKPKLYSAQVATK